MSRRWRGALLVFLALVGSLALARVLARPDASPVLAMTPLHLDTKGEVDVAVDSRQGRIFIVNAGIVQVFDTRTGARVYTARSGTAYLAGMGGPAPAVDERAGRVFVPNLVDDTISVLDARSGRVVRVLYVGHRPDAIAVDDHTQRLLVASTADWTLTVLDVHTGRPLRTRILAVGDRPGQLAVDTRSGHAFVAGYGGQVVTLSARTGTPLRSVAPDHFHLIMGLAVNGPAGRVLGLVEAQPVIVLLNAGTGALVRAVTLGQNPDAIAVDAGTGRAFVSDAGAEAVYVLGTKRGRIRRVVRVGASPLLAVDMRTHRVIVASAEGVRVLDARSGDVLRMRPLALDALALAVDERTGHVFAVTGGGTVCPRDPWAWMPAAIRRWLPLPTPRARIRPSLLRILDERRL